MKLKYILLSSLMLFSGCKDLRYGDLYIKDNMSTNDAIKLVAKERNVANSIIYKEYHNGK